MPSVGAPFGGRTTQRNDRKVRLRQTTWTLFLMRPVVASTNRRGSFRTGAEMTSDTSRRSTAVFALAETEDGLELTAGRDAGAADASGPADVNGVACEPEEPSSTVTTGRAAWEDAPLSAPTTKCAATIPFASRLSISTAGTSRLREKSARSRDACLRGNAVTVGEGSNSTTRRSVATSTIAASSARSTRRARSRRANSGSTRTSSGLTGSRSKSLSKLASSRDLRETPTTFQAFHPSTLERLTKSSASRRRRNATHPSGVQENCGSELRIPE
jgi:hypothetical protein